MNCHSEVTINKPLQQVWDYCNNPDNLKLWLNDFVRYEQLTGDVNAPKIGDMANQTFDQNGKEFTMKEEIIAYDPPHHIKLLMTHKWFDMHIVNDFEELGPDQTKLIATADTIRTNWMMKIMMIFMPSSKMQKDHDQQINTLKNLIEAL
ncbi:MAG: SRPBCC family protein [Gammaproteobacteria bacterium]|nr:SRPBCC family protein [Gammaproteobacteria bacterium]